MKENEIYELLEITKNDASKMLMIFEEGIKKAIEEGSNSVIEEIFAKLSDVTPASSCKNKDEFENNKKFFYERVKSIEIEGKPAFYVTAKTLYDKGLIRNKDKRNGVKWSDLYGIANVFKDEKDMDSPLVFARNMTGQVAPQTKTRVLEKNIYKKIQEETRKNFIGWIKNNWLVQSDEVDGEIEIRMENYLRSIIISTIDEFFTEAEDTTIDNVFDAIIGGMVAYLVIHGLFRSNKERGEKHIAYPDFKKWIEKRFFLSLTEEEYCDKMEMWIKNAEVGEDAKRKSSTILKTFHLRKSAPPLHYRGDFMKDLDAYFWGGVVAQAIKKDEDDYFNKIWIVFYLVSIYYFYHYHGVRVFFDAKPEWMDEEEWDEEQDKSVGWLKGFYDLPFNIV